MRAAKEGRTVECSHRLADRLCRSPRTFGLLLVLPLLALAASAQTSDDANDKPWSATSESTDPANGTSTHTSQTHTKNGNQTIDKQSVGMQTATGFQPVQDVERQSTKLNDTTTRSITRTYGRDINGQRILLQVTEEDKQSLPNGASRTTRSTSNPDANGGLQLIQREVADTRKLSPTIEETKTMVYLPGANGGLAPSMQIQERKEHTDEHTVQFNKSTMLPDGAGNWQVGEVRKGTITEDGKNRTTDETVSRAGQDGQLTEVSRTVGKESQTLSGDKRSSVETYSKDVPGASPDGSLHLVERTTGIQRESYNGRQTTRQQTEQINPGDPTSSLQVTVVSTDTKTQGANGTQDSRTLQVRGDNGGLNTVSVDMTKSDQTPVQVQVAPEKPAAKSAAKNPAPTNPAPTNPAPAKPK